MISHLRQIIGLHSWNERGRRS